MMSERTLKDDSEVAEMLTEYNGYLRDQMNKTNDHLNALCLQTDTLNAGLQEFQSHIIEMKRENYVQEVILDEGSDLCSRRSAGVKPPPLPLGPKELQEKVAYCTSKGLQMVSQKFKPVAVELPSGMVASSDLILNDVYEPIDVHLIRDLPPVIGTEEFNSWDVHEVVKPTSEINEITVGGQSISDGQPIALSSIQIGKEHHLVSLPSSQLLSNYADDFDEVTPPSAEIETPTVKTSTPIGAASDGEKEAIIQLSPPVVQIPREPPPAVVGPPKASDISPLFIPESVPPPPTSNKPIASLVDELKRIHAAKPEQKVAVPPPVKQMIKEAVIPSKKQEESDDSFDELFKQVPPSVVLPPAKTVEPSPEPKSTPQLPPVDYPIVGKAQIQPQLPQEQRTKARKTAKTVVKRSIFDTSSSSSEEDNPKRTQVKATTKSSPKPTPRAPAPIEDTKVVEDEEEMPKTVLNSVGGDFSSRLNAALLRRPQQPTYTAKPQSSTSAALASSSSSDTNEVDSGPRESVTALRGKLGASIIRAHTKGKAVEDETGDKSKAGVDAKPSLPTSEPKASIQPSAGKNDLIQTLKARPRPPNRRDPTTNKPPPSPSTPPTVEKEAIQPPAESETKTSPVASKPPASSTTSAVKKPTAVMMKKSLFDSDSDEPF